MLVAIAVLALAVAALYCFIGLYIVPRLARMADRSGGWIRAAQYGAAAFFLGCALTHVAIFVHTIDEPELFEGHGLVHLLPHLAQVVGGVLFALIAWKLLDVRVSTKQEARLVQERERLREQLERSQRLNSLGQLAGGVAHDFNNILAVILGFGYVLDDRLSGRPEQADLRAIITAAERGADLTRQMLLFGRGHDGEPDLIDVNRTIEGSESLLRRAVGEAVRLDLNLAPGLRSVRLGRGRVEQILLNLALNARDAMPDGGTLEIRTEPSTLPGEHEPGVRVTVSDSGTGMPSAVIAHAFDPFFSTKAEGEGTGLGLSMVHGIVDTAGGKVALESTLGEGTRITLELPGEQEAPTTAAREAAQHDQFDGATVLVVEDQAAVRKAVTRTLARRGARVIEAADAAEAMRLFGEHADAVDAVLTDIVMHGASGPELAKSLRQERPALPVVYMSGHPRGHDDVPVDGPLIEKPFTPDELVAAVADVLPVSFLAAR
jgi:signal transduction histidine kinase/CheY-like chemotaxis protein